MFGIGATEFVVIAIIAVPPLVLGFLLIYALRRGGQGGDTRSSEQSQFTQELYQGMKKLEARVESLETILLKRRGRD